MSEKLKEGYVALEKFKNLFNGSIGTNQNGNKNKQSSKSWKLCGEKALEFCKFIHSYVQLKKPQFVKACEYPLNTYDQCNNELSSEVKIKRKEIREFLKQAKHIEHKAVDNDLPNSYYAGIFDADQLIEFSIVRSILSSPSLVHKIPTPLFLTCCILYLSREIEIFLAYCVR